MLVCAVSSVQVGVGVASHVCYVVALGMCGVCDCRVHREAEAPHPGEVDQECSMGGAD